MGDVVGGLPTPDWFERMVGVAGANVPVFFALLLLLLGIGLLRSEVHRTQLVGYGAFALSAALIVFSVFSQGPDQLHRYVFAVVCEEPEVDSEGREIGGIRVEAEPDTQLWIKGRDHQGNYQVLYLQNAPFTPEDWVRIRIFDITDRTPKWLHVPYCAVEKPRFHAVVNEQESPDTGEPMRVVELKPVDEECKRGRSASFFGGEAWAQEPVRRDIQSLDTVTGDRSGGILKSATDVPLIYYLKEADQGRIERVLRPFQGRSVEYRDVNRGESITYSVFPSPRSSKSQHLASNAVWYGAEVPPDLARDVALALIEHGVELRYFGPYTYADTRLNAIEVGYSKIKADEAPLTADDLPDPLGVH